MRVLAFLLIAALAQANANPFLPSFMKPSNMMERASNVVSETTNTMGSIVKDPSTLLKPDEIMTKVGNIQGALTEDINVEAITKSKDEIQEAISGSVKSAQEAVAKIQDGMTADGIGGAVKAIQESATDAVEKTKGRVEQIVEEVKTQAETMAKTVSETVEKQTKELQSTVEEASKNMKEQVQQMRESAEGFVSANVLDVVMKPIYKLIEDIKAFISTTATEFRTKVDGMLGSKQIEGGAAVEVEEK